jgi:hypothetical protein
MTRILGPALLALALGALSSLPAQAQVRAYYYGRPPAMLPTIPEPTGERPAIVYGSGMGSPVNFGTGGDVYYSPGYALPTHYRYGDETYTPPGFYEPLTYRAIPFTAKPAYTYTPGYYTYSYTTPAAPPVIEVRPREAPARLYRGYGGTYR